MRRVVFLAKEYRTEPGRSEEVIGICDPEGEKPAYTTTDAKCSDKWIATIKNSRRAEIQFVPVDKNILMFRDNGEIESSCDGMILYDGDRSLCFIELKDVRTAGWMSEAIEQLRSTIEIFNKNHDYRDFSDRSAYAANCHHPNFHNSCREKLQEFRSRTHFRLMPQANVVIK
jgi:hypothetical protein